MDAVAVVEDEVRELVRRRGIDPTSDGIAVRRLVDEVVADYDERTLTSSLPPLLDPVAASRAVYDAVAGFGPRSVISTIRRSKKSGLTTPAGYLWQGAA